MPTGNSRLVLKLQCGHGPKTVENTSLTIKLCDNKKPLQCGHGPKTVENQPASRRASQPLCIQCGHGPKTVENIMRSVPPLSPSTLQCGHGPKTVENPQSFSLSSRLWLASMRPRPEDRGERGMAAKKQAAQRGASMRPRPEDRGEPRRPCRRGPHLGASMRPRPEDRGEHAMRDESIWEHLLLQCGHGPKTVENLRVDHLQARNGDASMRPRPEDRGEPSAPDAESFRVLSGFNAATARRPWRTRLDEFGRMQAPGTSSEGDATVT